MSDVLKQLTMMTGTIGKEAQYFICSSALRGINAVVSIGETMRILGSGTVTISRDPTL